MELREYLRIILAHIRLIVFLTLVTVVVATAGSFSISPKFKATTTVLIKSALTRPQVSIPGFGYAAGEDIRRKGETFGKILKSRVVSEKIVNILGLDRRLSQKNIQKQKNQPKIISVMKGMIVTPQRFIGFLKYGKAQKQDPKEGLINSIQGSISANLLPKTSIIEVSVLFDDPKLAADIANTAAKVFLDHIREMNSAEARVAKEFIVQRVKVAMDDLKMAQDNLLRFIIKEGSVYPETKMNLILAEVVHFESSLKNTQAEIVQIKTKLREIRKKLKKYRKTLKSSTTTIVNPLIQELKSKLINLEIQCSNLSVDYGPLHPKILALEKEIKKIKANLDSEVKRIVQSEVTTVNPIYQNLLSDLVSKEVDLSVYQEKKKAISQIIENFPQELKMWAEKQIEWDTLTSAVKFAQKNLDSLKSKLEAARITEAQKISEISVIDPAKPSLNPKGLPKVGYTFLGLLVGLMGGIGLSFFLEYIDDSVKTTETIEEELKLPVYGVIPEIRSQSKNRKEKRRETVGDNEISIVEEKLITHFEPRSPFAEAYRSLRTNIQFAETQEKTKTLLITSSLKGEGKTTTAANLSITTAQLGSKTLLIDGDLRNPMVHSIFGKQREPGLSNFIGGFTNINSIIVQSGIENLDIIASGPIPPNPSELLSSKRLGELIDNIKANYDFIIFDSPPIIAVTDAAVLSSKVHGVFLIIEAGKTSKAICLRAKTLLEKVNANILGAILNNVKFKSRYGYEYYYQYYYGEKKKKKKKI